MWQDRSSLKVQADHESERAGSGIVNAPAILHLNLRRKRFAKIAKKTKRVEYRNYTPYRRRRIENREYDVIQFRNGYATKAPGMLVEFLGVRKYGKGRSRYYAIRLGRILKIKRWRRSEC